MIAYGKRTPEGRSAAIGKRGKKEEALKGLRKGRISYAAVARGHPHTHNLAREFTDDERRVERERCTSGSGFLRRSYRASCLVWHRITYGIARRSASLSHRLSYDAPLVRKNRSSVPQAGERDVCGLPSSAGEGWNEGTMRHACIFTCNCGALRLIVFLPVQAHNRPKILEYHSPSVVRYCNCG